MSDTNRKKPRLEGWNYTEKGAYFITVCTKEKKAILCSIYSPAIPGDDPIVKQTTFGEITEEALKKIPGVDKYVIMPNHVHMIIFQEDEVSISSKIRLWKSVITAKCKQTIWQSSFYDHIIRDEKDYQIKWKYIDDNPMKWASDEYYSHTKESCP